MILVNRDTKKSYKFGKHGNYPGQLQGISSLAFSSVGNILVADFILNRVSMFSCEGEFILCFGTSGKPVRTICLLECIMKLPFVVISCSILQTDIPQS